MTAQYVIVWTNYIILFNTFSITEYLKNFLYYTNLSDEPFFLISHIWLVLNLTSFSYISITPQIPKLSLPVIIIFQRWTRHLLTRCESPLPIWVSHSKINNAKRHVESTWHSSITFSYNIRKCKIKSGFSSPICTQNSQKFFLFKSASYWASRSLLCGCIDFPDLELSKGEQAELT